MYRLKAEPLEMGLTDPGWQYTTSFKWKKWKESEKLIGCIESFYFAASQGIGWGAWSDSVPGRNVLTEAHLTADILKHIHMERDMYCSRKVMWKTENCRKSLSISYPLIIWKERWDLKPKWIKFQLVLASSDYETKIKMYMHYLYNKCI